MNNEKQTKMLGDYAYQMKIRLTELNDIARNLGMEYLACGIDYRKNSDPKKKYYKKLFKAISAAQDARFSLLEIGAKDWESSMTE